MNPSPFGWGLFQLWEGIIRGLAALFSLQQLVACPTALVIEAKRFICESGLSGPGQIESAGEGKGGDLERLSSDSQWLFIILPHPPQSHLLTLTEEGNNLM